MDNKKWKIVTLVLFGIFIVRSDDDIDAAFKNSNIVPEVVTDSPDSILQLTFEGGEQANLGNEISPSSIMNRPTQVVYDSMVQMNYTLIMIDADPPGIGESLPYLVWMVNDIDGDNVDGGKTPAPYTAPEPSVLTKSRYVILAYMQPFPYPDGFYQQEDNSNVLNTLFSRENFNLTDFTNKYNLIGPSAGNFFTSQGLGL